MIFQSLSVLNQLSHRLKISSQDLLELYHFLTPHLSPIEEHSKKPDITRKKIIEFVGDPPRVELFARQKSPIWDVWGNEVDSYFPLSA